MAQHHQTGQKGESIAADYLKGKGYSILDTNWRFEQYELDIVAKFGDDLVFVEVKTRSGFSHGYPEQAVNRKKAQTLLNAANYYLEEKDLDCEIRFDIIAILLQKNRHRIYHIEDAIDPFTLD